MVRILSRQGGRDEAPDAAVSDEEAMVRDNAATDRTVAEPAAPDARGGNDETVYGHQPAVSDRVGPVTDDQVGPTPHDRTGPVADDRVGPNPHDRTGPVADDRVGPVAGTAPVEEAAPRPRWNRVSFGATLGLILGLTALYAVLTGVLAQVGLLVGVLGFLLASAGFAGARRAGVTGHSLAMLGMLASAAAVVLGVLAITDSLSWLSTGKDNVPLVRDWVDAHLPWIKHW